MMNRYKIETYDELNLVLKEEVEKKKKVGEVVNNKVIYEPTGETTLKTVGFFPNLEKLLKWVVDRELNLIGFEDLEATNKKIIELKKFIEERTK